MLYLLRIEAEHNNTIKYAYFVINDCDFSPTSKKSHLIDTPYSNGVFIETKKMLVCRGKITNSSFRDKVYSNKYKNPCLLEVEDELGQTKGYEHKCSSVRLQYSHSETIECEFVVEASGKTFEADEEFYRKVNSTL